MASLNHFRAAQIVLELHGDRAEEEILSHVVRMEECEDAAGVQLWLCVLAALHELRRTRQPADLMH